MRILICNDDGIEADGLRRLTETAVLMGEVWVCAPLQQCSAMSHSLTLGKEMPVEERNFGIPGVHAYGIGGTPADCVKLGLQQIMPQKPDVVFSGINNGINCGYDIAYSATVACAMEAKMLGVPAIALSREADSGFAVFDTFGPALLRHLTEELPPDGCIWNLNFPAIGAANCKGVLYNRKPAPLGLFDDGFSAGEKGYINLGRRNYTAPEGTDLKAVLDGYISVGALKSAVL